MEPLPLPTPPELDEAPERAILAALEATLHLTMATLAADYPEIFETEGLRETEHPFLPAWVADAIASQSRALLDTLETYRHALEVNNRRPAQLPADDFLKNL
ncbi:MAG: hypothetical protein AB1781_11310 [Pseudomonadota bacterium]